MSDDADFVIVHWFQNYPQQPVAMVGSNRASREEIKDFFAPEMSERFFAVQDKEDLLWVAGGALSLSYYWSTPNNAVQKPAEFVSSIKSTLDKQGVDYEALISEAGDGLVEGKLAPHQMARMVGPGRWRLSHTPLKRDEGAMALSSWAEKAGLDPHYIENLALVFGSSDHGKVCMDVPNCNIREVGTVRLTDSILRNRFLRTVRLAVGSTGTKRRLGVV